MKLSFSLSMGSAPVFRQRSWANPAPSSTTSNVPNARPTNSSNNGINNNNTNSNNPKPQKNPLRGNTNAGGFRQRTTWKTTPMNPVKGRCEVCNAKLSLLGKRRTCSECKRVTCVACFAPTPLTPSPSQSLFGSTRDIQQRPKCRRCQLLADVPKEASRLMEMHVKDLRTILNSLDVPSHTCCEKTELVELILKTCGCHDAQKQHIYQHSRSESHVIYHSQDSEMSHVPSGSDSDSRELNGDNHDRPQTDESKNSRCENNDILHSSVDVSENTLNLSDVSDVHHSPTTAFAQIPNIENENINTREETVQLVDVEDEVIESVNSNENLIRLEDVSDHSLPSLQDHDSSSKEEIDQVLTPPTARWLTLKDVSSEEDISALSVQQLKGLLLRSSVDYKGCCEKWELVDRARRLWIDYQNAISNMKDDDLCRICMDSAIDCVLLECGHMVTCTTCGRRMNECPICRQYVVRVVHTFRA